MQVYILNICHSNSLLIGMFGNWNENNIKDKSYTNFILSKKVLKSYKKKKQTHVTKHCTLYPFEIKFLI